MMKLSVIFAIFLITISSTAFQAGLHSDLASLIAAERAFARTSAEQGTREAFLAFLAEDGIIFRPSPINGKKWMTDHPQQSGLLTWKPAFADIARSGDFGYTTGPYELRKEKSDKKPFRTGSFVSVWKRQSNGKWKVAIDTGIAYPPTGVAPKMSFTTGKASVLARANGKVSLADERDNLLELDRAFAKETAQQGVMPAFLKYLSNDARMLRSERYPMITTQSIRAFLKEQKGVLSWRAMESDVSAAGDIGYTYGLAEYLPSNADAQLTEYSHYLRIWKKQPNGQWRVVLDLATPTPPPSNKP